MIPFEFCATIARTGIISSRFFDLPKGEDFFRLLEIHRPRCVSHSGSVFVDARFTLGPQDGIAARIHFNAKFLFCNSSLAQ